MNTVYDKIVFAMPVPQTKKTVSAVKKLGMYNGMPSKRLGAYNGQNKRRLGCYC